MDETRELKTLTPQFNNTLIGHETAERAFLDAYNRERLHHAWLITGPKGVGKATLAWRFAKFLQCSDDVEDTHAALFAAPLQNDARSLDIDPDNPILSRISAGSHGGIRAITRTVNEKTGKLRNDIVIDDIRKLIKFFNQTASEGTWRIAIIDAVDELNSAAANALLKILEEPPEMSILFLVAHSPGRLLPTIRSRCRALALSPLDNDNLHLVLAQMFPEMPTDQLATLAHMSTGAPGRGVEINSLDGLNLYTRLLNIITKAPRMNMPDVHKLAGELGAIKADAQYRLFIHLLQDFLTRLVKWCATGYQTNLVKSVEAEIFDRFTACSGLDPWLALWEKVGELSSRADSVNLDRKQLIVLLFGDINQISRI